MKNIRDRLIQKVYLLIKDYWLISLLMILAFLTHIVNMDRYPYFENDEATYVSQAWTFAKEGKLAPYTYYYDHAPFGWMMLGAWFLITGGLTTFGQNPILSGRVFILVLHMMSVIMLYIITKRITRQRLAAVFTILVFSLSPLEIYYGRRVLLDNIMVFWMLLSLFFATKTPQRLFNVTLSGMALALSTLSKENAVFVGPAIIYIIWIYSHPRIRVWALTQWLISISMIICLYPLYASLKGEFLPSMMTNTPHVSLIDTTLMQASRGSHALPWVKGSDFYSNLVVWFQRDPWIIEIGAIALMMSMILNQKYKEIKAISLTAIAEIIFLARGALVFDFYILGVLPLLSMVIGIMIGRPVVWAKNHVSPIGYSFIVAFILVIIFLSSGTPAFFIDEISNQQNAIDWVIKNVPKNARVVVSNYAFPQLKYVAGFNMADFSFKLQYDPSIREALYDSNPYKIDYLLITHAEIVQMWQKQLPFVETAFNHSQLVADYREKTTSYIDIEKLISTNGDWAQVYKLDPVDSDIETQAWRNYKKRFLEDDGQVIDISTWITTSEGQSYAMLRAVEHEDKVAFDTVYKWTKANLQVRPNDSLFSWRVNLDEQGFNHMADINSATDADQDIAYSLLKAYQLWGDESYLKEAKVIISDIWKTEVIIRNDRYYLVSAPEGTKGRRLLINPSYIAPYYYRAFAKVDNNDWLKLIDDSYTLLSELQERSVVGLISNWILVDLDGTFASASDMVPQGADLYGYDAFRINLRLIHDYEDFRAQVVLNKLADFYSEQWQKYGYISSVFSTKGEPLSETSAISTSAGAVICLSKIDPTLAREIYQKEIESNFNQEEFYWGKKTDYYGQNWSAFALNSLSSGGENVNEAN